MTSLVHNLHKDEQIVCFFKKHPFYLLKHIFIYLILFTIITFGCIIFVFDFIKLNNEVIQFSAYIASLVILQIWIHTFFMKLIHFQFDIIVITNKGIIHLKKTLLLVTSIEKFELEKINEVHVEHIGLLENLFNFGRLKITLTTSEQSVIILDHIPHPSHYQHVINREIRDLKKQEAEKMRSMENSKTEEGPLGSS